MMRVRLAAVWIGLQLLFFVGWASVEQARLGEGVGVSILVRPTPIDPRDLLRGQFIRLAYDFNRPQAGFVSANAPAVGSNVWVVLRREGEFHVLARASVSRPPTLAQGEVALLGQFAPGRILFGIDRYFVPEGTPTPSRRSMTVRLRVGDDGRPRIEEVYVDGVPWP